MLECRQQISRDSWLREEFFSPLENKQTAAVAKRNEFQSISHIVPPFCVQPVCHLCVNCWERMEKEVPESPIPSYLSQIVSILCGVLPCSIASLFLNRFVSWSVAGSWGGGPTGGYPSIGLDGMSNTGFNPGMVRFKESKCPKITVPPHPEIICSSTS